MLGYEFLTGEGPYDARSNTQWITAHLNQDPKDLRHMRADVDQDVADLLRRCLNREPKHRPSAAEVARALAADSAPAAQSAYATSGSVEGAADLQHLIKRRVPQIVFFAAVAGSGLLGLVGLLRENNKFGQYGQTVFDLSLWFVGAGIAAATVVAWFHGEKGRQQTSLLGWILLSLIGVVWLTVSAWTLLSGTG